MRNLRTHQWSTPATIGLGAFVALSGLFMFFIAEDPVKLAHEFAGLAFAAAIAVHVLSNWRGFRGYFNRGRAVGIVITVWAIAAGLVTYSAVLESVEAEQLVTDRIARAPIESLAPVAGKDLQTLVDELRSAGYPVDDPSISVEQLAETTGAESDDVLIIVFR